jgi:hypothetical protein
VAGGDWRRGALGEGDACGGDLCAGVPSEALIRAAGLGSERQALPLSRFRTRKTSLRRNHSNRRGAG